MVGRKRGKSKKRPVMGSHQRCWIWGRHVVLETLRAGRWPIIELRIADNLDEDERHPFIRHGTDRGVRIIIDTPERLAQLSGASDHQGLLAKMSPYPYASLDDVLATGARVRSEADGPASLQLAIGGLPGLPVDQTRPPDVAPLHAHPSALVMLDRVQDPYNFGAIIRAADVLGMDGMIVGIENQSAVTSLVARSSAGAVNHLPIAQQPDLPQVVEELRRRGLAIVAADADASTSLAEQDMTGPTLLVLGNEHTGVSDALLAACDAAVRIPQTGHIGSLNVAVAAGILFYELHRQRSSRPTTSESV